MDAPPASPLQTIALVDDDRNILASVSIGLQAEGFATRVYSDGATALKALLAMEVRGVSLSQFAANRNLRRDALPALLAEIVAVQVPTGAGLYACLPEHWQSMRQKIVDEIGRFHEREPDNAGVERERLRKALATVQAHLATVDRTHPLLPAQSAGERTGYVAAARTLEPQDRAARLQGVVVSGAQGQLQANGQLQASGVFTQHGAESAPMFVPLLVLTDAKGQQIAEGYGKAMQMQAGQTTTVSLNLQARDLPPGPLYLAMVVSHPDTGKPIGQGQYRVQVQR